MRIFGQSNVLNVEKLKEQRDVDGLIKALKAEKTRPDAVRALGELGDPRAVAPIMTALKTDRRVAVTDRAVEALRRLKAVEGLIASLAEAKDWGLRSKIADALGELGDPRAVQPLRAAFLQGGWDRVACARALRKLEDRAGLRSDTTQPEHGVADIEEHKDYHVPPSKTETLTTIAAGQEESQALLRKLDILPRQAVWAWCTNDRCPAYKVRFALYEDEPKRRCPECGEQSLENEPGK